LKLITTIRTVLFIIGYHNLSGSHSGNVAHPWFKSTRRVWRDKIYTHDPDSWSSL